MANLSQEQIENLTPTEQKDRIHRAIDVLYTLTCPLCDEQVDGSSEYHLAGTAYQEGWRYCVVGDSEGVFCPDCQKSDEQDDKSGF